ncbi:glycoside hydrolase family 32 protein [Rothia endophytica]|uniref:glycoside hydrolase family 32 protein n=1 Tax=Rothia endophytica TaxID=1324766 RepID=UPI001F1AF436|nr:glycoside hydrolase family 32 protein [Rothia endophytica]
MTKPGRPDAAELLAAAEQAYATYHEQVRTDPDYPALHLAPPVGRLNDPNGLIYKDGLYHAFYQYSPVHPTRAVFWRYATSDDLTHWQDRGTAIAPTDWFDKNGCYSGSGFVGEDGTFEFFYTGNVKDEAGNREAYQVLFTSPDQGKTFTKQEVFINGPEEGYTAHYRDPHVVERDGTFYAVIGAQREDETGAVVIYRSTDRRNWDFAGEIIFTDPALADLGYMYECPGLIQLRDEESGELKDVLIFSPQGMEADGEKYNNIFQTGYVVGTLTGTHFEVTTPFTELDAGTEFYAPQCFHGVGADGSQAILQGWLGNADQDDQPSWENHWVHMQTYPRTLTLRGGQLLQNPVPQLDRVLAPVPVNPASGGEIIEAKDARVFRLRGTVKVAGTPAHITVEDATGQALDITLDATGAALSRAGSRYTVGGTDRRRTLGKAAERTFDLLIDASATELFVDGGAAAFASRVYFTGTKRTVRVQGPVLSLEFARRAD